MIEHVVLFKFHENTTTEQMITLCEMFKSLNGKIDGLIETQAGINFSENNKGFQVLLRGILETEEKLNLYLAHPEHRVIGSFSREIGRIDSIVMDVSI